MTTNSITVVGNATAEPELRTAGSQQTASFNVAVTRYNPKGDDHVSFFKVVCWGSLAENVSVSVAKGTRLIVSGRLEQRSWEGKDGKKQFSVEIVADEIGPSLRFDPAKVMRVERKSVSDDAPF